MNKIVISIITAVVLLTSCKKEKNSIKENTKTEKETVVNQVESNVPKKELGTAVCLYDRLSVRETPTKKGKWIASMSLGETVELTGEKQTDKSSKKALDFYKVRLIDGKEGWAQENCLGINGKAGVLLKDASVYQRPSAMTKTDEKYTSMDVVAIMEKKEDWVHVKGKRAEGSYIESAWIKNANISNKELDIAVAKYASVAMSKGSMTDRIKALQEIVDNSDFAESTFIQLIKEKIQDYESKNILIEEAPEDSFE